MIWKQDHHVKMKCYSTSNSSTWRKDSPPHRLFNDQWEYISTSKAAVKNVANKLLGTNCESINPTSTRQIEMSINRKQITNTAAGQLSTVSSLISIHLQLFFLSYLNNSLGLSCYVLKVFITKTTQPYQSFKVSLPKLVRNNTTVYVLNSIYYILKNILLFEQQ